jgi:hypothetical protein
MALVPYQIIKPSAATRLRHDEYDVLVVISHILFSISNMLRIAGVVELDIFLGH